MAGHLNLKDFKAALLIPHAFRDRNLKLSSFEHQFRNRGQKSLTVLLASTNNTEIIYRSTFQIQNHTAEVRSSSNSKSGLFLLQHELICKTQPQSDANDQKRRCEALTNDSQKHGQKGQRVEPVAAAGRRARLAARPGFLITRL